MRSKTKVSILLALLLIFLFFSILNSRFSENIITNNKYLEFTEKNQIQIKQSGSWDLTGSPILIDDSDPSTNWSYTASHYDWCSGSGSWTDPYVIENVTIDGQSSGNCLEIKNSEAYFIIRNCSLYNCGHGIGYRAAIRLDNVDNGKIINNNCSDNDDSGIFLSYSDNNTLSGNTASNSKYMHGIYLDNSNNNTLSANNASNNDHAEIYLNYSHNNTLSANNASNNDEYGIRLDNSDSNTLSGNTASNSKYMCGIYLWNSDDNTLSANNASNNRANGMRLGDSNNNMLLGNTVNNNTRGLYLENSYNNTISGNTANNNNHGITLDQSNDNTLSGNTASNNGYGIFLDNSNNNTLSANNASNFNYDGIRLDYSNNNMLSRNTASNNGARGIFLWYSDDNTLSGNTVCNNPGYGIDFYYSNNNTLLGNIVNYNRYGILLGKGNNNLIYNNTLINNNRVNAEDNGIDNHWDNGTVGNYWDDYAGVDANDDGIGDTPYIVQGTAGNQDNYPIWTDGDDLTPVITIIFPLPDSQCGLDAPNYNISIDELNLDTIWYTLDGGGTNYTVAGLTGTFNQTAWGILSEGNVTIRFYAKDTAGNIGSAAVTINKDTIPIITINFPLHDVEFGLVAPNYNISIDELNLDTIWYSLDGGGTNYTITGLIGTFNQTAWGVLSEGSITIWFYANDTDGKVGFAVVTVEKDINVPVISIIFPLPDSIFGLVAPNYNISIDELNLDTIWYTLDGGETNYTVADLTGTINQTAWGILSEGNVTIKFYAKDTAGNIGSAAVTINKDTIPIITINFPLHDVEFGLVAPNYNISIDELNLDTIWYTFDGGRTNYTITNLTGTLNQAAWEALSEGNLAIIFYAKDAAGNIGSAAVTVEKDISAPVITIIFPLPDGVFGLNAPNYNISIDELNLDTIWYTLDGEITNYTITALTGTFNQTAWKALSEGSITIRFYAKDTTGKIGFMDVEIIKELPDDSDGAPIISFGNYYLLFMFITILSFIILEKQRKK